MTDDQRVYRVAQAEWLKRAAEVAETLTDAEIQSLGRRVRTTTAEWLRNVAKAHLEVDQFEAPNIHPAQWIMRLLLEEREATLQNVQLGPREVGRVGSAEPEA